MEMNRAVASEAEAEAEPESTKQWLELHNQIAVNKQTTTETIKHLKTQEGKRRLGRCSCMKSDQKQKAQNEERRIMQFTEFREQRKVKTVLLEKSKLSARGCEASIVFANSKNLLVSRHSLLFLLIYNAVSVFLLWLCLRNFSGEEVNSTKKALFAKFPNRATLCDLVHLWTL